MSYITIAVLALTAIALIFGTLWGMGRGLNRSILRLVLIIACIAGAILLRPMLVEIIMGIDTGDGTIAEMIAEGFNQSGTVMPDSVNNLVFALVEIIIGIATYFIVFFLLRFITWILIYPICKIFVKKEAQKKKGLGALVGLIQGVVIAFAVVVPINGLAVDIEKISKLQMDGKPLVEIPAELGLSEHVNSTTNNIYANIGGWYYKILSTTQTKDGSNVSLGGAGGVISSMMEMGNVLGENGLSKGMKTLSDKNATPEEKVSTLTEISQAIRQTANSLDALDKDAQIVFDKILGDLKELVGDGADGMEEMFENLSIEKLSLGDVADCFEGFANYIDKTQVNVAPVTQEDVNKVINAFAGSDFLVNLLIGDGTGSIGEMYRVQSQDVSLFETAIDQTNLTVAQKIALKTALGVN